MVCGRVISPLWCAVVVMALCGVLWWSCGGGGGAVWCVLVVIDAVWCAVVEPYDCATTSKNGVGRKIIVVATASLRTSSSSAEAARA